MRTSDDQKHVMQTSFDRLLMGNVLFSMLSWFGLLTFLADYNFKTWSTGFVWAALRILLFVIATARKNNFYFARQFYIAVFILALPNGLLLFDASLRLFMSTIDPSKAMFFWLTAINLVITLSGFMSQFQVIKSRLRSSFNQNKKSGRLNIKNGFWNLSAPLYLDPSESEDVKTKRWNLISKISPLVTAVSFAVARTVDGRIQTLVVAIGLYLLGCIIVWGYARHLAIAFQLQEWEKIYHIEIRI
jgi:hypothetical protein